MLFGKSSPAVPHEEDARRPRLSRCVTPLHRLRRLPVGVPLPDGIVALQKATTTSSHAHLPPPPAGLARRSLRRMATAAAPAAAAAPVDEKHAQWLKA